MWLDISISTATRESERISAERQRYFVQGVEYHLVHPSYTIPNIYRIGYDY